MSTSRMPRVSPSWVTVAAERVSDPETQVGLRAVAKAINGHTEASVDKVLTEITWIPSASISAIGFLAMERAELLEHLATARRYAERGEVLVQAQRRIADQLAAAGQDDAEARRIVTLFEHTQQNHLDHVERLLRLFDTLPTDG
ncbi:hypothetical protein G5V57_24280 [Nordella sp. HKS 07]|uniref:hypothetical protein n=1 Tax=Nordella sp. HKS 07 TaxID=2712222 RepID=UPI0013E1D344|nr:hypothetical protein [Nordella sp. HKS 07]QIG50572.1 hypothetical protein G5V57_24280 [Nordella sp. HKS 07]